MIYLQDEGTEGNIYDLNEDESRLRKHTLKTKAPGKNVTMNVMTRRVNGDQEFIPTNLYGASSLWKSLPHIRHVHLLDSRMVALE